MINNLTATGTASLSNIDYSFLIFFLLVITWSIIWKGLALWKAAKKDQKVWFVIFLFINTVGLLEIIYLIINRKVKDTPVINPIAPRTFAPPTNPNL